MRTCDVSGELCEYLNDNSDKYFWLAINQDARMSKQF